MMPGSGIFYSAAVAAIASFFVSVLIVSTQGWHGKHTLDGDLCGVQKIHKIPVPRVGGIALLSGILLALVWTRGDYPDGVLPVAGAGFLLLIAGMPAFLAGLLEDLTKKVSVKARLIATFASALLACWLLDASLHRLDIWGIDYLLGQVPFVAIVITAVAVAGVTNAINIIDGFHGIAATAVIIIMAGMAFLSWQAGDRFVMQLALLGIGATLGFLFINYPAGRLFMGDGGAYFLGFWLAEVAVLLVARNPAVNAWQVLAICAYPITEVLYSIYRRRVVRRRSPGAPDRLHLHSLLYRRLVCQRLPRTSGQPWIRNAAVACIVGTWIAAMTLFGVWFGGTVPAALAIVIAQVLSYMAVYTRLVRGHWCLNPVRMLGLRPEAGGRSL